MEIIFFRRNGIIALLFLTVFTLSISAQAPSCKSSLSPICMLHTGTYNKHSKTTNTEIQIGQGTIFSWNTTNDVYIPTNRPGWAIGLAVAHTMFTNLMGFECMSINEYMATAMQETNCGCDGSITKPAWAKAYPVNPAVYCSDYTHGVAVGFFQEEYGTGWAELKKDYPCFIPKVNFDTFVTGKNFEILIFNRWGEQIYQSTDYTQSWDGTDMGNKVQEDVYIIKILYGVNQENGTVKRKERVSKLVLVY